jgi:hypothetical protein
MTMASEAERQKASAELRDQVEEFTQRSMDRVLVVENGRGMVFGPFATWAAGVAWGVARYGRNGGFRIELLTRPEDWYGLAEKL